jgi:ubiquinone/menaquinone biosynthesis C-methylase UbiE
MRRIDYDAEQYHDYARGRALTDEQLQTWLGAFGDLLPAGRPLTGLDVGSGTGRFTPALARTFGPVTGVEPSVRMREAALGQSRHPEVQYVEGSAEDLPVPSAGADYALMFLSWHHVEDKPRAVRELARALRPSGRLLLRENFSDHIPPSGWWLEYFPRGYEVDAAMFQPLHEVIESFTSAGWRVADFRRVLEPSSGTRADMLERLRLHTHSTLAHFTPDELETGFRRLERAIADDPDAPAPVDPATLLTLELPE